MDYDQIMRLATRPDVLERERVEREAAAQLAADEHKASEAAARARFQQQVDARKAEIEAQKQAEIDAALEPERVRRMRLWLAERPDKTEADFNQYAWPQLRPLILAEREEAAKERAYSEWKKSMGGPGI